MYAKGVMEHGLWGIEEDVLDYVSICLQKEGSELVLATPEVLLTPSPKCPSSDTLRSSLVQTSRHNKPFLPDPQYVPSLRQIRLNIKHRARPPQNIHKHTIFRSRRMRNKRHISNRRLRPLHIKAVFQTNR